MFNAKSVSRPAWPPRLRLCRRSLLRKTPTSNRHHLIFCVLLGVTGIHLSATYVASEHTIRQIFKGTLLHRDKSFCLQLETREGNLGSLSNPVVLVMLFGCQALHVYDSQDYISLSHVTYTVCATIRTFSLAVLLPHTYRLLAHCCLYLYYFT
jgi:hypothetical protein